MAIRSDRKLPGHRASCGPRSAYRASVLTPVAGEPRLRFHEDAIMIVGSDGVIESIRPYGAVAFDGIVQHFASALVIPALVDAHLHFPQTRVIGSATGPLLDWLQQTVFPEELRFANTTYAREVAGEFIDHALSCGTGTVGAFSSSSPAATEVLLDAMVETGIRGVAGLTLMDQRCPEALQLPPERALPAVRELIERFHRADAGRIEVAVTPRFALSCSEEMMRGAGELATEHNLVVQTHVSENAREGAETLAAFPWADDYVDVYDKLGLLGPRTILAHAVHLSPGEWDRLAERGAAVAHCPDSNAFLGSGRMRLAEATRRRVKVSLGSDVAAGRTFDMRRAISSAYDAAIAWGDRPELEDLLWLATLGGAESLGLGSKAGSLEVGKDADFVVLGLPSYLSGREGALRAACFGSDVAPVARTYVRGRLIYRA